jgi:hypothetical protein
MRKYISILILAIVCLSSQVFAGTPPVVTSANVSTDGKSITVVFSKPLATYSPTQARKTFTIKVNGTSIYISTMTQLNSSTIVFPNLSIVYGNVVTISYSGTILLDAVDNTLLVATFTDLNVTNGGISIPSVSGYIENFNDNTLTGWNGGTQYVLTESGQVLTVAANTDASYKSMAFTIPVAVNMTTSPTVTFTLTTVNPIDIRVDVQDVKGFTTNNNPPNVKTGLTSGTYTYTIAYFTELYDSLGTKLSSAVSVDKTIIKRVFIFTNPGATYSGSFTIDDLTIGVVPIAVTGVTVTPTTVSMNVGENKTISAVVSPTNATNQILTWTSSDKTIATVGTNGVVTAVAQGTVTITATSLDNATLFATTSLTVASTVVNKTTLASEITTANNLKNAAVVGLQSGQYLQTDIDAFSTAILNAEAVNNDGSATQASVDAMAATLQTAISTFTSKAIVINKQALASLISTATGMKNSAVTGTQLGQYAQTDIDALAIAITNAELVNNSTTTIQTTVDAMVTTLSNAMTVFTSKVVSLDKSVLTSKISTATSIKNAAVVGTQDGQYSQGAVDSLATAISNAQTVNTNSTSQSEINAMVITLQSALDLFSTKMISSTVTKVALQAKINAATTMKNSAVVGIHVGQYSQADSNTLATAISNAEALNINLSATQSGVSAMVITLQNAMDAFSLKVVPAPSKSSLLNAINSANTLLSTAYAGTAVGQYPQTAIDALTMERNTANTFNNSTTANQLEIDAAKSSLQTAIQTFQLAIINTDIREMDAVSISALPVLFNESITIKSKGMQMKSVTMFAITGSVVLEEKALSESINFSTTDLPKGLYLILVKLSNGDSKVLKVVK